VVAVLGVAAAKYAALFTPVVVVILTIRTVQ